MNRVRVLDTLSRVVFQAYEEPGAEVPLPEFARHGIQARGWRIERKDVGAVPAEARNDWEPPNWQEVATACRDALSDVWSAVADIEFSDGVTEQVQAAFDRYSVAEIAQAELDPVPEESEPS